MSRNSAALVNPSIAFFETKSSARPQAQRVDVARPPGGDVSAHAAGLPTFAAHGQGRRTMAVAVLAVHLLMFWGFLQLDQVRRAVLTAVPVVVRLLPAPTAPVPPAPTAILKPSVLPQSSVPQVPPPLFEITQPQVAPPITVAAAVPAVVAEPVVNSPRAAPVPTVAQPVAIPAAPALKRIAPGSVRYRVEPRMSVPLMSRRLHESGVVVLRIAVDARGILKSAAIHQSSGFERLDQQALLEIRTARFVPQTENGQAIEWETLAPMSYELD